MTTPHSLSLTTVEESEEYEKVSEGIGQTHSEYGIAGLPNLNYQQSSSRVSLSRLEEQPDAEREGSSLTSILAVGSFANRAVRHVDLANQASVVSLELEKDCLEADTNPGHTVLEPRAMLPHTKTTSKTRVSMITAMPRERFKGLKKARTNASQRVSRKQKQGAVIRRNERKSDARVTLVALERLNDSKTVATGPTSVQACRNRNGLNSNMHPEDTERLADIIRTLRMQQEELQESQLSEEDDPLSSQVRTSYHRNPDHSAVDFCYNNSRVILTNPSMRSFIPLPSTNFHRSRWRLGMIVIFLVGAVTIGCIVALFLITKKNVVIVQVEVNVTSVSTEGLFLQQLQAKLLGPENHQFLRPGTPQLQATIWLAVVDEPKLNVNATNLKQRYALMVLWYANGGNEWMDQNKWAISGLHECEWAPVKCNSNNEVLGIIKSDGMLLTGSLMSEIGLLSGLEVLNLPNGRLQGGLPKEIYSLTNLRVLDVSNNRMSSTISDDIGNLMNLREFNVYLNFFSGTIPSTLSTAITTFKVSSNDFTGNPWDMLLTWPSIEYFDTSFTPMYGSIPTEIGLLTTLVHLDVQYTNMEGSIPSEIGHLSNLESFIAASSALTGSIPSELFSCSNLIRLDLGTNLFHAAPIPTMFGMMTKLELLILSHLSLTGTIPTELQALVNLYELVLSNNLLTGTIPSGWHDINLRDAMWFDYNKLTGSIPAGLCPGTFRVDCIVGCSSCATCICH